MRFVRHPRTATTFSWWALILFTGLLGLGLAACSNSTPLETVASKTCLTGDTTPVEAGQTMRINVLSNRADLISGGDALVEIVLPQGAKADSLAVDVGGRNVGDRFGLTENGRMLGVITGLPLGNSVLTARLPGGAGARITLANHLIGRPIFSGPHLPWTNGRQRPGARHRRGLQRADGLSLSVQAHGVRHSGGVRPG